MQDAGKILTIQDVALAAGVSTASVSLALSGSRPVRPDTRQAGAGRSKRAELSS